MGETISGAGGLSRGVVVIDADGRVACARIGVLEAALAADAVLRASRGNAVPADPDLVPSP